MIADISLYLSLTLSLSLALSTWIFFFGGAKRVLSFSVSHVHKPVLCVCARAFVCVCVCVYILHVRMQHSCKCSMYTKAGSDCDRDGLGAHVRVWGERERARKFGQDKQGGRQKSTVYQFRRFCLLFESSGGSPNVHAPSL
jgi:hypothetical protein